MWASLGWMLLSLDSGSASPEGQPRNYERESESSVRRKFSAMSIWRAIGELAVKIFRWTNMDSHDFTSSKYF